MHHIRFAFLVLAGLVLLTALAVAATGEPDPRVAAWGVRLEGLRPTPTPGHISLVTPNPATAGAAAGRLLLHRKGCTGCHDLDLPAYPHTSGPDLAGIGRKTHPGWLNLWLSDPTSYLPHSRMPRIRLGNAARARLVAWLTSLGSPDALSSPPLTGADVYRGGRLFDALQCQGCHAGGGTEAAADLFANERFCTPCHQFAADGLALEGKLLQNTYAEWLASPAAEDSSTCQSCHMAGGDHRMRGLHDRDFVRDAVTFEAAWNIETDGRGRLDVTLRNVGAGHALPTYATGALHVKVFLSDSEDGVIENSLRTRAAQRRLSPDGQTELFDTRIPAGGAWHYEEHFDIDVEARHINVLVEVDPDHFYRQFFALLEPPNAGARALLEQARGRISDSPYILYARQISIADED